MISTRVLLFVLLHLSLAAKWGSMVQMARQFSVSSQGVGLLEGTWFSASTENYFWCCFSNACISLMKLDLLSMPEDSCLCLAFVRWPVLCLYLVACTSVLHSFLLLRGRIAFLHSNFYSVGVVFIAPVIILLGSGLCPGSLDCYHPSAWLKFKVGS